MARSRQILCQYIGELLLRRYAYNMDVVIEFVRVWRRESKAEGVFYTIGEYVYEDIPTTLTSEDDFHMWRSRYMNKILMSTNCSDKRTFLAESRC